MSRRYTPPPPHPVTHYFGSTAIPSAQDGARSRTNSTTTSSLTPSMNMQLPWEPQNICTEYGPDAIDSLPFSKETGTVPGTADRGIRMALTPEN